MLPYSFIRAKQLVDYYRQFQKRAQTQHWDLVMSFISLTHGFIIHFYFTKQLISMSENFFEKLINSHTLKQFEEYPEEKIMLLHAEAHFTGPYSQPEK